MILKLTRELGVNLAGVEIILNMREKMEAMQRQIESFVTNLNREFQNHESHVREEETNSLIPVVRVTSGPPSRFEARRNTEARRKHNLR